MKTIPIETVDEAWDRLAHMPEEDVEDLLHHMAERQPALLGYLSAADEECLQDFQRGTLLHLGLLIHEIVAAATPSLRPIDPFTIEAVEQQNIELIERMAAEAELRQHTDAFWMVSNYNQTPLLGAALEALMQDAKDSDLANENIGVMLLHLKTLIDCLDR